MTEKPKRKRAKKPAKNKGGRPEFKPSLENRMTVEQMKFCGESENVIARAIGIDPDTLRKHFPEELANGHANRRREVIGMMFKGAQDGNASLIKRLEEIGRAVGGGEEFKAAAKANQADKPKAPAKLGKKEQAAADAANPDSSTPLGDLMARRAASEQLQ